MEPALEAKRESETAGVVARPPLIFLGFLGFGLALDAFLPWPLLPDVGFVLRYAGGGVLAGLGLAMLLACLRQFRRRGTPVQTWKPTTALVTDGPYRVTRNPIYLGLFAFYLGLGVLADTFWIVALGVPLFLVLRYGVVAREEAYLERRFGEAYRRYCGRVRRWI
jgi:protein-S-isoprenylcysteine O-methyltransferase Ste14